jgi:hypothetical protein
VEYARQFAGVRIFDLCDPDFLSDGPRCQAMLDVCDAITCPSESLAAHVAGMTRTPVRLIPDRLDLDALGERRKAHYGPATTVAWFGYATNYPMLDTAIDAVLQCGIPHLLVIADAKRPYRLPPPAVGRLTLTNRPWGEEAVYDDLLTADIVLNPRSEEGRWRFKSDNKTVLAWALGLPVARDGVELSRLLAEDDRRRESERRYQMIRDTRDVRRTVDELRALIDELRRTRDRVETMPAIAVAEEAMTNEPAQRGAP